MTRLEPEISDAHEFTMHDLRAPYAA